jgi:transposase
MGLASLRMTDEFTGINSKLKSGKKDGIINLIFLRFLERKLSKELQAEALPCQ